MPAQPEESNLTFHFTIVESCPHLTDDFNTPVLTDEFLLPAYLHTEVDTTTFIMSNGQISLVPLDRSMKRSYEENEKSPFFAKLPMEVNHPISVSLSRIS